MNSDIDVSETLWFRQDPTLMELLLKDHTTQKNIFWATDSYASKGKGFEFNDEITIERITGDNEGIIRPRCAKSREEQTLRTKEKAEVFTPSWICNKQNNLIDSAWFGRENVFNTEHDDGNTHSWVPSPSSIVFPEEKKKGWKDYVRDTRLEITCGEAPYLANRYDTITGEYIPVKNRIGLLDRKLRIVSENTETTAEWLDMAQEAYKNTYGYDWQGDNVLLARESLLMTFIEYYMEKFGSRPMQKSIEYIAYIVSWNIWQMDGLKFCLPGQEPIQPSLFEESNLCLIRDWRKPREKQKMYFAALMQKQP